MKTKSIGFLLLTVLFFQPSYQIRTDHPNQLIIWNVGQGQWVTWSQPSICYHFDMGGDKMDWNALSLECKPKTNLVFFSHGDMDHINMARKAKVILPNLCALSPPLSNLSYRKKQLLKSIPVCNHSPHFKTGSVQELTENLAKTSKHASRRLSRYQRFTSQPQKYRRTRSGFKKRKLYRKRRAKKSSFGHRQRARSKIKANWWKRKVRRLRKTKSRSKKINPNDNSRVYLLDGLILIPGDSPQKKEWIWLKNIKSPWTIKYLVVGHHGSRTSTSNELLKALTQLRFALISARKKKYGHPHPKVMQRLKHHKIISIKTEDWGHIRIQTP